jgi:ABC-type glycerol-3-phosphate transport system substrate-binding protein
MAMSRELQIKDLWNKALTGQITRREVMQRGAALGMGGLALAALSQETLRATLAQEERDPTTTFYSWMLDLHPNIYDVGDEVGVDVSVAPTENFGSERFIAEALQEFSTWDWYGGVTPFLEMIGLVETGTITPWTPYVSEEIRNDIFPSALEEGTYNGEWYVWPLLLDIIVQGWNADLVEQAGLDPSPEAGPKTWDEYIANARTVQESGVAPYGLTFDNRDWRSLIPVTHTFSTDVYTEDGLFIYNSDAAVNALEVLKQMMELTSADVLQAAGVDNVVLPDEAAFAAQQAAYYFKYQNAHVRNASQWPDPSNLILSTLPVPEGGEGATVFWNTGAVLFEYGSNREKAVEMMTAASRDDRIWENTIVGNEEEGTTAVGQMPVMQSVYAEWEANPPDFVSENPWVFAIRDALAQSRAIAPSILSISQFDAARPEWHKYLSGEEPDARTALTNAFDAARERFRTETGRDPN